VSGIYLLEVASRRTDWLSVRQAAIAENVANANTPGYRTRDVTPFSEVFERTSVALATTHAGHIAFERDRAISASPVEARNMQASASGNSVSVEQELIKAGEVNRDYALTTSVVKAFHRMWMMSARG